MKGRTNLKISVQEQEAGSEKELAKKSRMVDYLCKKFTGGSI